MGPGDLAQALQGLSLGSHPDLLVGPETGDDAGVVRLTDELALIQTVDFFTPIVDDPFTFGRIAAVNAFSDVYAMGGRPLCAMNLVAFPRDTLGLDVLRQVLKGGLDAIHEAGVPLVGGHSIVDPELKYGLAVSGLVHPRRIWTNLGGQPGDQLLLTKPLGTGVVSTALKRGKADPAHVTAMVQSMSALNRGAAEALRELGTDVHACTDVTGFGLLGHLCEMLPCGQLGARIQASQLPVLPGTLDYLGQGIFPGGLKRNREYRAGQLVLEGELSEVQVNLVNDPQTSGGLLAAVSPGAAQGALERLQQAGLGQAAIVGQLTGEAQRVRLAD